MRLVHATIIHAYHVHKTFIEYLRDVGKPIADQEALYRNWADKLTSEAHRYILIMHGKKVVGMVWGRKIDEGFLVEGKFLRRALRGKFKFTREIRDALKELTKDSKRVLMILNKNRRTIPKRYEFHGVLVEAPRRD